MLFLYCRQYLKCKLPTDIPQHCFTVGEFDFSDRLVTAPFVYSTFQTDMVSMSERSSLRLVAEIAALGHFLAFGFVMPPSHYRMIKNYTFIPSVYSSTVLCSGSIWKVPGSEVGRDA